MNRILIGQGRVSHIFKVGNTVHKTYPSFYQEDWILNEVHIQNEVASKTDLNVLKCSYLKNDRAIEMNYIDGKTLGDRMRIDKYKDGLTDLIELQCSVYQYADLDLSQAHDVFQFQISQSSLEESLKKDSLEALSKIKKDNVLCHFDFHFLNIMYEDESYKIIDWVNAKSSNPVLDVARTYVIMKQYTQRIAEKYLKLMSKKLELDKEEIQNAIIVMAALRLMECDDSQFAKKLKSMIN